MKLEQSDKNFLFSETKLPDIFFTEYMSQANGDYIKVYLYIVFLSKYNKEVKINDVSKTLNIPFKTIQEAIAYWEEQEVLIKKNNGYIVVDLQEKELNKLYSPRLTSTPENALSNAKNQYRAKAIEDINNTCFQGMMSPSWYNDIDLWFNKYGFDEPVMIALFRYCLERSALHRNYIQAVAEGWHKNNIKTYTDLENYYAKQEKLSLIKKQISKKLGLSRPLTQYESAYIEKWVVDYSYTMDIIEIALKKTTSKSNFNFDYLDKLISNWHEHNLLTTTDVNNYLAQMKIQNQNKKTLEKQTNYKSFEQRTYNDLDSLYANN